MEKERNVGAFMWRRRLMWWERRRGADIVSILFFLVSLAARKRTSLYLESVLYAPLDEPFCAHRLLRVVPNSGEEASQVG